MDEALINELCLAFSARRSLLLKEWLYAHEMGQDTEFSIDRRTFWAERIRGCNYAQTVFLRLRNV
jgi:hypothetical protein